MSTIIDWYRRTYVNPRNDFTEMLAAVREIRSTVRIQDLKLKKIGDKMAEVDDAVAALTPKLEANHQEIVLVLDTYAANQAALKDAIDKLSHAGATPETIAAIQAASDKADADLKAMQDALAIPPASSVDTLPPLRPATTTTTTG